MLKSLKYFLILCLVVLSMIEIVVLKSPNIIVELSISPFKYVRCYVFFGILLFGTYTLVIVLSDIYLSFWNIFISNHVFYLHVHFVWWYYSPSSILWMCLHGIFSHPFTFILFVPLKLRFVSCKVVSCIFI